MKKFITLFFLFFTIACRRDTTVEPADSFYQRWRLFQSRRTQEADWTRNADSISDTEFSQDGTLIYRRNGTIIETPCCASSRFERNAMTILFTTQNACPYAQCSSITGTNSFVVTSLSSTLLELRAGDWISQYTPVK